MGNIFYSICVAVISTTLLNCIVFWITFKNTLAKIEKRINENEKILKDVIEKYEHGYNPDHICESCYEGRYSFDKIVGIGGEAWFCDKCKKPAPPSWHYNRTHHHSSPSK